MKCVYKTFLLAAAPFALLVTPVLAQPDGQMKLKGFYAMTEEGVSPTGPMATLAALTFTESGGITGTLVVRTAADFSHYVVQGSYFIDSTRSGTLTLSSSVSDEEGNGQLMTVQYRVILSPTGEITAIRSNPGYYTVARFLSGIESGWSGNYSFAERSLTKPLARLGAITLDASGNVSGIQIEDSLGILSTSAVTGNYALSGNGFGNLTLLVPGRDAEGDAVKVAENYLCLATKDELKMLRTHGESHRFLDRRS